MKPFEEINLDEAFPDPFAALPKKEAAEPDPAREKTERACCLRRRTANIYRRAFSEVSLLEVLPYHLEQGTSYHVLTAGDVDALSFVKHVLRLQRLDFMLLSTWCLEIDDILQLEEWLKSKRIGRLDAYLGEIFQSTYARHYEHLSKVIRDHGGGGRLAVFRNHSKIFAGIGPDFAFGCEGSSNINTNPRTENTCLTVGPDIFEFFKGYFDGIRPFNGDPPGWAPWIPPSCQSGSSPNITNGPA